ncbi:hypothetical protein B0H17DRAFT_1299049 [Mycena rosella]|uniref:RING-type domain-containing protein n=1 Tax=Mycena rosella TaxID=1033263 RepID=A0AAD7GUE5_MYCRO|nr:hypothetical protein B0H17DRAFT_1299049 [Mycena rosella]
MLSLGPGSACDVCLEPFGVELKTPCSIPCGHVFCVSCLQHIARTCPLCRSPFEARHIFKLHLDLEPPTARSPSSTDQPVGSLNNDEGARQLQQRITNVAMDGATEAQTTQLTEECKKFLDTVPKQKYSDLRTASKMLTYMCYVKRLYVDQGRTVNQLTRNGTALNQEIDRLKAAVEVLKGEKRRLEQAWQTVSAEKESAESECRRLNAELDRAEAEIVFLKE